MQMGKHTSIIVVAGLSLALLLPAQPAAATEPYRYFPETGRTVAGGFLEFFDAHGGLPTFGYPITDEVVEEGRTVQYFERARFEWHPENPLGAQVQLGLLGEQVYGRVDLPIPDPLLPDVLYVPQTGHTVAGPFLALWKQYGVDVFGYPISEPFQVGGRVYQYFQRARMEIDSGSNAVRLGSLGQEWLLHVASVPNPPPSAGPPRRLFSTGFFVSGDFLQYYETRNGKENLGNPISGELQENGRTVQYFEKGRLELYPENDWPYRVQPSLIGLEVFGHVDAPAPNLTAPWSLNQRYFPQTGHLVTNAFLAYFDSHGGADIIGYPISEAQVEGGITVQYFQRAKLEWHPENPIGEQVVLTQLGQMVYSTSGHTREPLWGKVGAVWHWNPPVQAGAGLAMGDPIYNVPFTWQLFEGGEVFERGDTNQIYTLYKTSNWDSYPDTWTTREPEKIGYHTPADRYEPTRGIGKVWRSLGGAGSALGWATTKPRTFQGPLIEFERGLGVTNGDGWVYFVYNGDGWAMYEDMWGGGP
jgi:hypothetical protein